jgi:hypothetical protein
MATAQPPSSTPAAPSGEQQITIVSHSTLFYWWPVWAIGFLLFLLTYFEPNRMAVVPSGTTALRDAEVKDSKGGAVAGARDVLVLPKGARLAPADPTDPNSGPANPRLHITRSKNYGVLFTTVVLLVIVITNVPLRGMWSAAVIALIVILALAFALFGLWETILSRVRLLDIRINAGGYLFISTVLFLIWLFVTLFFDPWIYMVFTPGQFKVRNEIGGGERVYSAEGMSLERQRGDLFRHWILGLGSGDLVVKTSGAQAHHFDMPNVLFISRKVQQIEDMLKKRTVVETR